MRDNLKPAEPGQARLAAIVAVLVFIPLCFAVVAQISGDTADTSKSFLQKPDPKYEDCIKDEGVKVDGKVYMRFHHWEHLRSVREKVVRHGKRDPVYVNGESFDAGLSGCPECHTSRERFCDQCHNAASVVPDCFGCHYYP